MPSPTLREHLAESLRRSAGTIAWLIRIMVPASAVVFVLRRLGILEHLGQLLEPLMSVIGLPGEAAMALISSVLINLYAVIAMVPALGLDHRQLVILGLLCLVAHNFLVELAVARRTGTPVTRMVAVRLAGGLFLAWTTSILLPSGGFWNEPVVVGGGTAAAAMPADLGPALGAWAIETGRLLLRVTVIVSVLVVATRWLQFAGITDRVARLVRHPLRLFGLPAASAPAWIVANTLGLAYGAAVLREEAETGRLDAADGDLLNHHLGVSHSLIEDTALFVALGAPVLWIIVPRLALALAVVWERRLERVVGVTPIRTRPAAPGSVP